jgi:uncharacterized protein (TIGR03545 family)
MIRWKYAAPRLVLATIVLLMSWLAFEPMVRWGLIATGQAIVGARVDVARFQSALLQGRVQITGVEVANPKSPRKNMLQAASANLEIDTAALLRRQFVIRDGNLMGLRFSTDRDEDGTLEKHEKPEVAESDSDFQEETLEWLRQFGSLLNDQVAPDFESVQVAREMGKRWPQEYEALQQEAEKFRERIRTLRDTADRARQRPLENLDSIQQTIEQATRMRQDTEELHRRLQRLQAQVHEDKRQVEMARRRDIQKIEDSLRLEGVNGEALSQYFLGPEMASYFTTTLDWLTWAKRYLDLAGDPPRPERSRGTIVEFPRLRATQDLLIERLAVEGEARVDQLPVPFHGTLTGISSDPVSYGKPAQMDLELEGLYPARLQVVVDGRGERTIQKLTFDCTKIPLGKQLLGKNETLALGITECDAHAWVQLTLDGQQLDGRILWKQDDIRLQPTLGNRYGGARATSRLQQAVADVDHVHAVVKLSGTIRKPKWKLSTPLGNQLAQGISDAAHQELQAQRDALVTRANLEIAQELAQLEERLADKREQAIAYLRVGEEMLGDLQQLAGGLNSIAGGVLPRNMLPQDLLPQNVNPGKIIPQNMMPRNGISSENIPQWARNTDNSSAIPAPSRESFRALDKLIR